MDCCVRVFYGGIVRKEDGMFEGMDEEMKWFDKPPSFDDLCGRLHDKFGGDFIFKGMFDSEKTRAHYVVVPLRNPTDWSQWPPYYGEDYAPHPDLKKVGKGRRKKKRLKGDMDAMRGYGEDKYGGGLFDETHSKNLCSVCKLNLMSLYFSAP
jgi:hypothetical protein